MLNNHTLHYMTLRLYIDFLVHAIKELKKIILFIIELLLFIRLCEIERRQISIKCAKTYHVFKVKQKLYK